MKGERRSKASPVSTQLRVFDSHYRARAVRFRLMLDGIDDDDIESELETQEIDIVPAE